MTAFLFVGNKIKSIIMPEVEQPKKLGFFKKLAKVIVAALPFAIVVFSKLNDEGKGGFAGGVAKKIDDENLIK